MPLINSMGILRSMYVVNSTGPIVSTNYFDRITDIDPTTGNATGDISGGTITSTGGAIIAGRTYAPGVATPNTSGTLIKTDSYGYFINQIRITSPQTQGQYSLTVWEPTLDSSDNIYTVGTYSDVGPGTSNRCFLAKFDSNLNLVWQRILKTPPPTWGSELYDCSINPSNNTLYSVGFGGYGSGLSNALLLKHDMTTGSLISYFTISASTTSSSATSITLDSSGNYYIATRVNSTSIKGYEISKWNTSDVYQWSIRLGTTAMRWAKIVSDTSGNIFVGIVTNTDLLYIFKINSSGAVQWQKQLSGTYEQLLGLVVDTSGNLYVNAYNTSGLEDVAIIMKIATNGTIVWQNYLSDPGGVYASSATSAFDAIDWKNGKLWIGCLSYLFTPHDSLNWSLPDDGTLTGTYSGFTYLPSSITLTTSTLTVTTLVNTSGTMSMIDGPGLATISSGTATQVVQAL